MTFEGLLKTGCHYNQNDKITFEKLDYTFI